MFASTPASASSSSPSSTLDPPPLHPTQYHPSSPHFQLVPLPEDVAVSTTSPPLNVKSRLSHPPETVPPSASLQMHRASISSSTSTADQSSSKGSPASPRVNLPVASTSTSTAASSTTTTTKTARKAATKPFIPPPPPPPLSNPLDLLVRSQTGLAQLIGHGNVDARPSRQNQNISIIGSTPTTSTSTTASIEGSSGAGTSKSGSCSNCRSSKSKCSQDDPVCSRCLSLKIECSYPVYARRGRKRAMTPNQVLLENCHRDIERALELLRSGNITTSAGSTPSVVPSHQSSSTHTPNFIASTTATDEEEIVGPSARELKDVMENPLALLAHISSLKVGGDSTTDEESGKHFLPQQSSARDQGPTAEGYFATGLYQLRSDADPAYDPINLGIITESLLARFVAFYFGSLHPWTFHLTPSIHTPQFLRNTSPFLTTALACVCATFDPTTQAIVPSLFNHLQTINTRIWTEGLKSLEIVQAYMILIHWTPIANNWGDDRRWGWLGTAIRIATEIKLHKTLNQVTYDFYRSVTPLGDDAFQQLSDDRIRSWRLISVAETALGVSTGRLGAISNLSSVWPGPPTPENLPRDHPHYNIYAILELTKIYANGICLSNNITDSDAANNPDIRASFKSKWSHDIAVWRQTWPHANHYVRMICSHNVTILLSICLRFRGPVAPILEECRAQAFETASLAVSWPDDSYKWGSNLSVVVVAYAATLLLRIGASKPGPLPPVILQLCGSVADKLLETGAVRPHTRTLATLHGTRVRTLLSANASTSITEAPPPSLLPVDLTVPPPSTFFTTAPQSHDLEMSTLNMTTAQGGPELHLYPPVFPAPDQFASLSSTTTIPASIANLSETRFSFDPFSPPPSTTPSSILSPSALKVNHHPHHSSSSSLWNSLATTNSTSVSDSNMMWDLFNDHQSPAAAPSTSNNTTTRQSLPSLTSNLFSPSSVSILDRPRSSSSSSNSIIDTKPTIVNDSPPPTSLSSLSRSKSKKRSRNDSRDEHENDDEGGGGGNENVVGIDVVRSTEDEREGEGQHQGNDPIDVIDEEAMIRPDDSMLGPTLNTSNRVEGGSGIGSQEDWVHRNALETDWLNSEPGAWAW